MTATVEIRMYHVGFGDAFRVTVRDGDELWRMLVDCGVHFGSEGKDIRQNVLDIIDDLKAESIDGTAHLDVVVATHHHQDHIVGFAEDEWAEVQVDDVWLPFVENPKDPDTVKLGGTDQFGFAASQLQALIEDYQRRPGVSNNGRAKLALALEFAANSGRNTANKRAMSRLTSNDGLQFAVALEPRFLPSTNEGENTIDIGRMGIVAHILGPSRDPAMLKKMTTPKRVQWLNLDEAVAVRIGNTQDLFEPTYVVDFGDIPEELVEARNSMSLNNLVDEDGILLAASVLESATNNTSLFFVLQVGGLHFLFPGDAQHGAWEHVRTNAGAMALIEKVDFYKVGHHGSHNSTPRPFVEDDWTTTGDAMVPWGSVERFNATIPKQELMTELTERKHRVVLPGDVREGAGTAVLEAPEHKRWTQLTYTVS